MSRDWQMVASEVGSGPPRPMPQLIWQMLHNRGFGLAESVEEVLNPSLANLRDPGSLDQMPIAVERLLRAREKGERICIYADFDLDGTSGCALMLAGFQQLGFTDVIYYQPRRLSEGYGLHQSAIDAIAERDCQLLVTVDVGITAVEAVTYAKSRGLDVIITDHHLPKSGALPEALAVINPNKGSCSSQLHHLSGAGVAFYLILALAKQLRELGRLDESMYQPKRLLDCFAIGTLTDLVPLKSENRVLIKHGLISLAETNRPGLRELLKALNLWGRPLTSTDVAIRFAPKLNALSRLELGILPIDLFLEVNEEVARSKVQQVIEFNQIRVSLQKEAEAKVLNEFANQTVPAVIKFCTSFHRGVVGLVATRVAQELGVPAFIGAVDDEGRVVGSARIPPGSPVHLPKLLQEASQVLDHYGGHAAAAGFQLSVSKEKEFAKLVKSQLGKAAEKVQHVPVLYYDGVAQVEELNPMFMSWCEHLEPFGTAFATPLFRIVKLAITQCKVLRGGHLKLRLRQGDELIEAVWFSPPKDHFIHGWVATGESREAIDVLAEPQWNYFAGKRTLQLLIQDLRWHEPN